MIWSLAGTFQLTIVAAAAGVARSANTTARLIVDYGNVPLSTVTATLKRPGAASSLVTRVLLMAVVAYLTYPCPAMYSTISMLVWTYARFVLYGWNEMCEAAEGFRRLACQCRPIQG